MNFSSYRGQTPDLLRPVAPSALVGLEGLVDLRHVVERALFGHFLTSLLVNLTQDSITEESYVVCERLVRGETEGSTA